MKIAIIGAGFTGLAAGLRLVQSGHTVEIFEKADKPGGLALGFQKKGWEWTLEEYYHHFFTNADAILSLAKELNYSVITKRPKTSMYIDENIYQLDSPLKLLQFPKLSLLERLRMGAVVAFLRYTPYWMPFEKIPATTFLRPAMGQHAYETIWEGQLTNKFGRYINDVSLAWFCARIKRRTPALAYPEGGFLRFAETIAHKIESLGGKLHYNTSIEKVEEAKGKISLGKFGIFDKVIVTLPSFAFVKLCPQLPQDYSRKLTSLKGIGAQVLILRLQKPFLTDGTYWLSICQKNAPVMGIFEHTNFMDKKHYNNEHLVYIANYLEPTSELFTLSAKQLLQRFDPFLQKIHPKYDKALIGIDSFQVPFAQPIMPVNYSKMVPPFKTPLKNVYLANMQQVYPWDRETNYAVELGEKVAKMITN